MICQLVLSCFSLQEPEAEDSDDVDATVVNQLRRTLQGRVSKLKAEVSRTMEDIEAARRLSV